MSELSRSPAPKGARYDHLPKGPTVALAWNITLECAVHGRMNTIGHQDTSGSLSRRLDRELCPCLAAAILASYPSLTNR